MTEAIAARTRLIRWPEVHDLTGIPKSTAYDYLAAGTFPVPVKLSARSVAWKLSDVLAWIESRQSARPAKAA
jgi:prophage regulatory protein